MSQRTCRQCGASFDGRGKTVLCGPDCRELAGLDRDPPPSGWGKGSGSKPCEGCGKIMIGPPSAVARRRFCDWTCRTAHFKPTDPAPKHPHKCKHCGVVRMIAKKRLGRPYCSMACRNADYLLHPPVPRIPVPVACGHCGKAMVKSPGILAQGRGKFCSRQCAALARPLNCRPSAIATDAIHIILNTLEVCATPEMRVGAWSIDLALTEQMVALELDGEYWHGSPTAVERDARKDTHLASLGWTVVRVVINKRDTPESLAAKALARLSDVLAGSAMCPT